MFILSTWFCKANPMYFQGNILWSCIWRNTFILYMYCYNISKGVFWSLRNTFRYESKFMQRKITRFYSCALRIFFFWRSLKNYWYYGIMIIWDKRESTRFWESMEEIIYDNTFIFLGSSNLFKRLIYFRNTLNYIPKCFYVSVSKYVCIL